MQCQRRMTFDLGYCSWLCTFASWRLGWSNSWSSPDLHWWKADWPPCPLSAYFWKTSLCWWLNAPQGWSLLSAGQLWFWQQSLIPISSLNRVSYLVLFHPEGAVFPTNACLAAFPRRCCRWSHEGAWCGAWAFRKSWCPSSCWLPEFKAPSWIHSGILHWVLSASLMICLDLARASQSLWRWYPQRTASGQDLQSGLSSAGPLWAMPGI